MPANLNALIRYKTINACLSGGMKRWSIQELMEKCTAALAEYRGRYESVSERTLRDDIRVMRSEILGYNAPIAQERGMYFYSDPAYSIMNIRLTDAGLALQIIRLLEDLRREVNHPELEQVLEKLKQLQPEGMAQEAPAKSIPAPGSRQISVEEACEEPETIRKEDGAVRRKMSQIHFNFEISECIHDEAFDAGELTWGAVMRVLTDTTV